MNHKTAIALGFFDGVHLGHRSILRECVRLARELGAKPVAVTFDKQPRAFLNHVRPNLILTREDRERAILDEGIEEVFMLPFDYALASMKPETFVRDLLAGQYHCAAVVCGYNYSFGAMGKGNGALLRAMEEPLGFRTSVIEPVLYEDTAVSSTWIRRLIADGDVRLAGTLLGRPWTIGGVVSHGRGVGTGLGFPTGNLALDPDLVTPRYGVYAARMTLDGKPYACALNVGVRPTFGLTEPVAEFNVLGFSGDLYGRTVRLELLDFLREERIFDSPDSLSRQIGEDIARIGEIVNGPAQ